MKYPLDEIFLRRGKIYSANIVAKTVCDVCIGVKRLFRFKESCHARARQSTNEMSNGKFNVAN